MRWKRKRAKGRRRRDSERKVDNTLGCLPGGDMLTQQSVLLAFAIVNRRRFRNDHLARSAVKFVERGERRAADVGRG